MAQWIRPLTFSRKVSGSNLLAAIVVPFSKALYPLYPRCLVPRKGFKAVGPLVACCRQLAFFSFFSRKLK